MIQIGPKAKYCTPSETSSTNVKWPPMLQQTAFRELKES